MVFKRTHYFLKTGFPNLIAGTFQLKMSVKSIVKLQIKTHICVCDCDVDRVAVGPDEMLSQFHCPKAKPSSAHNQQIYVA